MQQYLTYINETGLSLVIFLRVEQFLRDACLFLSGIFSIENELAAAHVSYIKHKLLAEIRVFIQDWKPLNGYYGKHWRP